MTLRKLVVAPGVVLLMSISMSIAGCGDGTQESDLVSDVTDAAEADIVTDSVEPVDSGRDTILTDTPDLDSVDTGTDTTGPVTWTVGDGQYTLVIDNTAGTLTLSNGAPVALKLDFADVQVGAVAAWDPTLSYDPYPMLAKDPSYYPPAGLEWLPLTSLAVGASASVIPTFDAVFGDPELTTVSASLLIVPSGDGRFAVTITPHQGASSVAYFRLTPTVSETENFYGLGAYLDQVAHRGKVRAMQLELDFGVESGYNEAHVPVPLLISTAGWGIFVESWYPGAFDCAANDPTKVDIVFGTGEAATEGFKFHLYAQYQPLDITGLYYKDTVDALLPARWGLGPVVWKDEVTGQAEVEWDLAAIRELKFPTTAYWIDRPYASGVNAFDFHPTNYSDPQAMINLGHDMGFRMALWSTPYISEGKDGDKESSATTEALHQYAADNGYFVKNVMLLNKWSAPIDFTNPDAYAWFQGLIRQYTDMGIEGFKLDYGEDIVVGLLGMDVQDTQFFDGSTERTMHAKYQTFYHRIFAETLPEDGGFLICRRGVWGDQANVSVIWPGDLDASFAKHRDTVGEGSDQYVAVGGLPASVIYGLSLGVSGFPFFGSDTGGYRHSPPNRELFIRWAQQTALSSIMQVGNSSNTVPWDLDSGDDLDESFQDIYRDLASLHLRLWPYEWTYAKSLAVDGRPIQRPIGLMWPYDGVHPDDQYMFGDSLLVAPVVTEGAVTREVYFPSGNWMDWFNGDTFTGPATITVDAPLDKLPLYIREGSIVPLLRPDIQAMAPVADGYDIDTYADDPGILYPVVHGGLSAGFELFDGTELRAEKDVDSLELYSSSGTEFVAGAIFDVLGVWEPIASVEFDGAPVEASPSRAEFPEFPPAWVEETVDGVRHIYVWLDGGTHSATLQFDGDMAE